MGNWLSESHSDSRCSISPKFPCLMLMVKFQQEYPKSHSNSAFFATPERVVTFARKHMIICLQSRSKTSVSSLRRLGRPSSLRLLIALQTGRYRARKIVRLTQCTFWEPLNRHKAYNYRYLVKNLWDFGYSCWRITKCGQT